MSISKIGVKLSGSIITAAVLSFFLCISINAICNAVFTKDIGYTAYVYEENSEDPIANYEYYYSDTDGDGKDDGVDTQKTEYEDKGYTVSKYKIRSTLSGAGKALFLGVTQLFSFILIISFASSSVYKQGFKDANLVRTGNLKADILKGLKIGTIANIPFFALFVLLIIFALGIAPNFRTAWYAILNSHYYTLILLITGADKALELTVGDISVLQFVLLFLIQLIVPVISAVAYILGFKEIKFSEKLIYKKESR